MCVTFIWHSPHSYRSVLNAAYCRSMNLNSNALQEKISKLLLVISRVMDHRHRNHVVKRKIFLLYSVQEKVKDFFVLMGSQNYAVTKIKYL